MLNSFIDELSITASDIAKEILFCHAYISMSWRDDHKEVWKITWSLFINANICWLTTNQGYLLWGTWVVKLEVLWSWLLQEMHFPHPGMVKMKLLAHSYMWWQKQGHSQGYIKGGSKFNKSLVLAQYKHKFTTWQNTWPPKITCTIQLRIWFFTLYCKNKVINYVSIVPYLTLRANACCCFCSLVVANYAKIMCRSICAWLANINPIAEYYIWYSTWRLQSGW